MKAPVARGGLVRGHGRACGRPVSEGRGEGRRQGVQRGVSPTGGGLAAALGVIMTGARRPAGGRVGVAMASEVGDAFEPLGDADGRAAVVSRVEGVSRRQLGRRRGPAHDGGGRRVARREAVVEAAGGAHLGSEARPGPDDGGTQKPVRLGRAGGDAAEVEEAVGDGVPVVEPGPHEPQVLLAVVGPQHLVGEVVDDGEDPPDVLGQRGPGLEAAGPGPGSLEDGVAVVFDGLQGVPQATLVQVRSTGLVGLGAGKGAELEQVHAGVARMGDQGGGQIPVG